MVYGCCYCGEILSPLESRSFHHEFYTILPLRFLLNRQRKYRFNFKETLKTTVMLYVYITGTRRAKFARKTNLRRKRDVSHS